MKEDLRRILFVLVLLFVGIAAVLVFNAFMNMQTEGLLVGILLAPLLAYALLSDGIREFSAFGVSVKSSERVERS